MPSIHYAQPQPRNGDQLRCAGAHATVAGVGVKPLYHLICIAVPRRNNEILEQLPLIVRIAARADAELPAKLEEESDGRQRKTF
ncbi:MAG: hypothetical protein ACLPQY_15355 [Streptosporangiaceae bacterium]